MKTARSTPSNLPTADAVRDKVREGYAQIARVGGWSSDAVLTDAHAAKTACCGPTSAQGAGGCCGTTTVDARGVAESIGYSDDDLALIPEGANMGLSCGNPTAIATLKPGEVVLDLGAGGGFDVFLAGAKVGPQGRAIGVDMTADMISRARANAVEYRNHSGLDNVEFRLGEIEHLPVADASIDVVISNCVINLSPDKPQVYREIARVLKPGGRVAVSDLALLRPLPEDIRGMVEALIGCITGAVLIDETRAALQAAGLVDIQLTPKPEYVRAMSQWQDPLYLKIAAHLPPGTTAADFITSLDIQARKPAPADAACCSEGCCTK